MLNRNYGEVSCIKTRVMGFCWVFLRFLDAVNRPVLNYTDDLKRFLIMHGVGGDTTIQYKQGAISGKWRMQHELKLSLGFF